MCILVVVVELGHMVSSCTERKSRLTKWLGKLFNGSGRETSNGRYPQLIGEESAVWRAPSSSRSMVISFVLEGNPALMDRVFSSPSSGLITKQAKLDPQPI